LRPAALEIGKTHGGSILNPLIAVHPRLNSF
jgi:hypothetical protein